MRGLHRAVNVPTIKVACCTARGARFTAASFALMPARICLFACRRTRQVVVPMWGVTACPAGTAAAVPATEKKPTRPRTKRIRLFTRERGVGLATRARPCGDFTFATVGTMVGTFDGLVTFRDTRVPTTCECGASTLTCRNAQKFRVALHGDIVLFAAGVFYDLLFLAFCDPLAMILVVSFVAFPRANVRTGHGLRTAVLAILEGRALRPGAARCLHLVVRIVRTGFHSSRLDRTVE